jgi:hypothetical protein
VRIAGSSRRRVASRASLPRRRSSSTLVRSRPRETHPRPQLRLRTGAGQAGGRFVSPPPRRAAAAGVLDPDGWVHAGQSRRWRPPKHLFAGAGAGASPAGADPLHVAGPVGADDAPGVFCCGLARLPTPGGDTAGQGGSQRPRDRRLPRPRPHLDDAGRLHELQVDRSRCRRCAGRLRTPTRSCAAERPRQDSNLRPRD